MLRHAATSDRASGTIMRLRNGFKGFDIAPEIGYKLTRREFLNRVRIIGCVLQPLDTSRPFILKTRRQSTEMELLEIYDQYYDRVKKFITRLVKDEWIAEDLIQETFIRVQKNIDSVRDPSKLSSWILRIAYNLCQDHFKSQKKNSHDTDKPENSPSPFMEMPVQKELEQFQMGACVQEQINLLPEQQRIVLILYDLLGFNHAEIADILDITRENSKVRLLRARKGLKSILEEKCTFELDGRNVLVCEPVEKNRGKNICGYISKTD